ncbi:DNA-binding protein WhiA [bacterium]|nr:DNA-binding protein WhiA [bacterium]
MITFTISLKEEIAKNDFNIIEARCELEGFLNSVAKFNKNEISITLENASIARRIYKELKEIYNVNVSVIIRIQKRFKVKQIYILTVKEKIKFIKESIKLDNKVKLEKFVTEEEKNAFLQGAFLAVGNISNPSTSGYHLEYIFSKEILAKQVLNLLNEYNLKAKLIKRGYKYIVYIKSSECISDLIKRFKAINSLFYFEDIRIYKDHKNMVNRLNNCEIANQEKSFKSGQIQINNIKYLKEKDIFSLLDEKTQIVANSRIKYPEVSMNELAEIISLEEGYKIGKSGVNHHFIKISNLVKKYQESRRKSES